MSAQTLDLPGSVDQFVALEGLAFEDGQYAYQMVVHRLYNLLAGIRRAELLGLAREEILRVIEPARALHAQSPLVRRAQVWPRGYPGDFETIEYMCDGVNRAAPGSIGHALERYCLNSDAVQQHRNKVTWQASKILEIALDQSGERRILSIACGGSRDLRSIQPILKSLNVRVYLNDFDRDALALSLGQLQGIQDRVRTIPGNVFKTTGSFLAHGPYDLVLAGGLFDYLTDEQIIWLLPTLFECLAPGGRLCFTNLLQGNPLRVWMQYCADWIALERTEEGIRSLVQMAGLCDVEDVSIARDATGLAGLVELRKTLH